MAEVVGAAGYTCNNVYCHSVGNVGTSGQVVNAGGTKFRSVNWNGAANVVYKMYSPLCHQWAFRSFFLFGEQAYYPHAAAGIPGVIRVVNELATPGSNEPLTPASEDSGHST